MYKKLTNYKLILMKKKKYIYIYIYIFKQTKMYYFLMKKIF